MKNVLHFEGRERGLETVRAAIAERVGSGRRVLLYNLVPTAAVIEALTNATDEGRNPRKDRYRLEDFEGFLDDLGRQFELVPVFEYWEESKEPLYLFGRRLQPIWEVRKR